MTKYGRMILELVSGCKEHLTAEEIYLRLKESSPRIVLATVYNNLNSLCSQGLIRRISMKTGPDRYDQNTRHDHLICRHCGKISDVHLENMTKALSKAVGQPILSYDLKIQYLCPECKKALEAKTQKAGSPAS